jgi:hypothetical protein
VEADLINRLVNLDLGAMSSMEEGDDDEDGAEWEDMDSGDQALWDAVDLVDMLDTDTI